MTREQAIEVLEKHISTIGLLAVHLSAAEMAFCCLGADVEDALGLPEGTLAKQLIESGKVWQQGLSDHLAALTNAAKGQLAHTTEDEWSEVISDG